MSATPDQNPVGSNPFDFDAGEPLVGPDPAVDLGGTSGPAVNLKKGKKGKVPKEKKPKTPKVKAAKPAKKKAKVSGPITAYTWALRIVMVVMILSLVCGLWILGVQYGFAMKP